jgi:hypothetical protein
MLTPLTSYTKNKFYYQLVERHGDWVVFRQSAKPDSTAPFDVGMAWEVFKIHVSKEAEMLVKNDEGEKVLVKFAPKECAPSNEQFGNGAWSCCSLKRAREKLEEAIENEKRNKERREKRELVKINDE